MSEPGIKLITLELLKTTKRIGISPPDPKHGKTLSISIGQNVKFAPFGRPDKEYLRVWVMSLKPVDTLHQTVIIGYIGEFTYLITDSPQRIQFRPCARQQRTTP